MQEKIRKDKIYGETSKKEKFESKIRSMVNAMKKAQIILYAILNLHDKAVKIALECNDIQMAK